MALPDSQGVSIGPKRFRSTWTYGAGLVPAQILQCRVLNINLTNWTVDVIAQFDRYFFFDIQVGAPYLHHNNGEGMSCFPEVGSTCMVVVPSDTSPPYVSSFLMPVENVDISSADNKGGGSGATKSPSGASFAGGRPKAKPGDIWLRTRDDNFVILHRGGVLQLGATELSQRICIPLNHFMMDISQNFAHHNSDGSIIWGIQEGPATGDKPGQFTQTFRVLANDKYADVRIKAGKVTDPIREIGDTSFQSDYDQLNIGKDIWVYEVAVSKNGFEPETGVSRPDASKNMSFRFAVDRSGGTVIKAVGSMLIASQKRMRIIGREGIDLIDDDEITLSSPNRIVIDGGTETHVKGSTVRLGKGSQPVAHQGALVQITMPYMPMPMPGPPLVLYGIIVTGEATVMV